MVSQSENDIKCRCGQKEGTKVVTEETPTEFSTVFTRRRADKKEATVTDGQGKSC